VNKVSDFILIDMLAPKSHANFNSFFLHHFDNSILYTSLPLKNEMSKFRGVSVRLISNFLLGSNRFIQVFLWSFWIVVLVLKRKRVLILSYDVLTFPALCVLSAIVPVYVFEHNTLPERHHPRYKLYSLLNRIPNRITRLCLTKGAVTLLADYTLKARYVGHPFRTSLQMGWIKPTSLVDRKTSVFCPSGGGSLRLICEFAGLHPDITFYCKGSTFSDCIDFPENIILLEFLEDYEYMAFVVSCSFVLLAVDYGSRASGPFYDAACLNNNIIFSDGDFSKECIRLFGENCNIQTVNDFDSSRVGTPNPDYFRSQNENIVNAFIEVLS